MCCWTGGTPPRPPCRPVVVRDHGDVTLSTPVLCREPGGGSRDVPYPDRRPEDRGVCLAVAIVVGRHIHVARLPPSEPGEGVGAFEEIPRILDWADDR